MARAVRVVKDADKERKDLERIRTMATAEDLKAMVEKYKLTAERDILDGLGRLPVSDIAQKQAEYKATIQLIRWLDAEIAKGKKSIDKLSKEDA